METVTPAAATLGAVDETRPQRTLRHAVVLIAAIAALAAMWMASAFLIPLVASITLAALLAPLVVRLGRWLHSRVIAALLVLSLAVCATAGLATAVATQLAGTTERLPTVLRYAARDISILGTAGATMMRRTRAALNELDRSVARVTGVDAPPVTAAPRTSLLADLVNWVRGQMLASGVTTLTVLLQAGVVVLMTFFLLCSGESLVRQLAQWAGARHPKTPHWWRASLEMARQVRLYAGVLLVTNLAIGLGITGIFAVFGVEQPWAWGLCAVALHFVPYAGMAVLMALTGIEVYAAQASLAAALSAAVYAALLGVVIGTAVTAWLQGRAARIDGALMFIGTVFWTVLWGGWGLVLGPVLVIALRIGIEWARAQPAPAPASAETEPPAPALPAAAEEPSVLGAPGL